MARFLNNLKRRVSLEGTAEESFDERLASEYTTEVAAVPEGYELIQVQQPDGTVVAVRRKLATWQLTHRDSLMSSRPVSSTPSFRTITSRTSDGNLAHVQRSVRDMSAPLGTSSSRPVQARSAANRVSFSPSVLCEEPLRDTMRSTMTIVEDALAAQLSTEPKRHSRRDGSAIRIASGTATSDTSGDIHIGHVEELNGYDNESDYASSDYDEGQDYWSDDGQNGVEITRTQYRKSYGSCALLEIANFSQPKIINIDATQRKTVNIDATQPTQVDIDSKTLPEPPSAAYILSRDTVSWGYGARLRAREHYALQRLPSSNSRSSLWARRFEQGSAYLMACCSVVLPAAFLGLGILIISMNGHTVSHSTSTVISVVGIAAAIWPVVFAAVVAQCFKTWFLLRADRWSSISGQVAQPRKLSQRLRAVCLVVLLVWCLSPFGSQALERACGLQTTTKQTSTDVWYVDRTGYNPMWSANATDAMSTAERSELVQIISEKYIGSLAPSIVLSDKTKRTTAHSLQAFTLSDLTGSVSSSKDDSVSSSMLHSLLDFNGTRMSFPVITSRFEFSCDNWNLAMRHFDNTTKTTKMSYSESQTLGLSMSGSDNSTMTTISFASLNKITGANSTTLASRGFNSTSLRNETWEYSSIQCRFEQLFYSNPVQCERDQSTGVGACNQSAPQSLILNPVGILTTELGDFAQDLVSANPSTAGGEVTATEEYIQNGGSVNPISLTAKRDNPVLLNLSATVSPQEFAQNFGHLFNTWVSLGYCPQCSSDFLAGNNTVLPATLQPFYRHVNATTVGLGGQVFIVHWAWVYVLLAFSASLLMVAVTSVAIEAIVLARPASQRSASGEGHGVEGDGHQSWHPAYLQLPKTCSVVTSCEPSPQWAKGVVQETEAATGYPDDMHI